MNAIVGEAAASHSSLPGPIAAGTWSVVIGKAKLAAPPGEYLITVPLRDAPTLAPQPERASCRPATLGQQRPEVAAPALLSPRTSHLSLRSSPPRAAHPARST